MIYRTSISHYMSKTPEHTVVLQGRSSQSDKNSSSMVLLPGTLSRRLPPQLPARGNLVGRTSRCSIQYRSACLFLGNPIGFSILPDIICRYQWSPDNLVRQKASSAYLCCRFHPCLQLYTKFSSSCPAKFKRMANLSGLVANQASRRKRELGDNYSLHDYKQKIKYS